MADDKTKKDFRDRDRVAANEDYELDYLAKKHGVTRGQVIEALEAVGDEREKVEAYLTTHKR
jgi:hypothetical protein